MQKIVKLKTYYYVSIILAFILLSEITFKDFFHNHEFDLHHHDDCPVLVLDQSLNTGIIVTFDYKIVLSIEKVENDFIIPFFFVELTDYSHLRSPPIS